MRSTSRRLPDEAGSALDDSTFEFLGDSLIETSDDEAHTESLASTEGATPDDASEFSDDDVDYGTDHEMHHSSASFHADASEQQHDSRSIHSTGESTLTEVPAYSEATRKIGLNEQSGEEPGVILASKVIRTFPDETGVLYPVFGQYGCPQVRLVVKAALSQESIPTPESYRILYIGMPEKWVEDVITAKISAALTACPSTSRSIMVQGQLEPYGPVMHVYRCTDIQTLSKKNEPARVAMNLDNGKQVTSLSGLHPDLVVFCHPSIPQSAADAQGHASAREVFIREKVPCLDMTSVRQYGHGAQSYDSRSLSVCMEGRNDSEADFELKEVLHIDHYTFNDLEPSQINRHLALISPQMLISAEQNSRSVPTGSMWKAYTKRIRAAWSAPAKMLTLLMVLTGMVVAYLYNPVLMPMLLSRSPKMGTGAVYAPISELCTSSPSPTVTPPSALSISSSPSIVSAPKDLTVVPPQIKPKEQVKKKTEKVAPFEIQTDFNHQFKLIPHKDLLNSRKKPQLQIQVSRDSTAVPIRYNRTISGIYVVDLEQEHPFGAFNVSIASYSKPLLQQSFEIALGHNKTMLVQFLERTRSNIINTQRNLLNVSTTAAHELLTNVPHVDTIRLWNKEISQDVASFFRNPQSAFPRQLSAQIDAVKQVPDVAWLGVRKVTAPVRKSSLMLRARMNALRVRCKMERRAGLSGNGIHDKQSWACSKVQDQS
ncbi:hypothetical protein GQ44DRAFT_711404 [Phaeosphaeriaceae sp. PMI808]|nr:hypothetical protein GQ44DRAFT_711404 [Phaeosphaeriaceae sp. PMI808]